MGKREAAWQQLVRHGLGETVREPRYLLFRRGRTWMSSFDVDDKTERKVQAGLGDPLSKGLDRRRFLHLSALAGASLAMPALAACATPKEPGVKEATAPVQASAVATGAATASSSLSWAPPDTIPLVMPPSTGKKLRIGNGFQPALSFWQRYQAAFLLRLEELKEEAVYVWSEPGFGAQIAAVESVIQQNVDVVVLSGMNKETITPILPEIQKRNIRAIGMQNDTPGIPLIGQNSFWAAALTGMYVIERLGGKGNLVLFNTPGLSVPVDQTMNTIRTMLKFFPDIKVVAEVPAKFPDAIKGGLEDTENLLRRMPGKNDIHAILATFDDPLIGAARAIKDAGRDKDIFLVGTGGDDAILGPMAEGDPVWGGTAWIDYWEIGRKTADMAVIAGRGGKVPALVNVYGGMVTQSNAAAVKKLIDDQNKVTSETLKRYGKK